MSLKAELDPEVAELVCVGGTACRAAMVKSQGEVVDLRSRRDEWDEERQRGVVSKLLNG